MPKKSISTIVEESMPGWEPINPGSDALPSREQDAAPAEQTGTDSVALRRKYKQARPAPDAAAKEAQPVGSVKLQRVVPKGPMDAEVGAKTVVVDTKAGKLTGAQG